MWRFLFRNNNAGHENLDLRKVPWNILAFAAIVLTMCFLGYNKVETYHTEIIKTTREYETQCGMETEKTQKHTTVKSGFETGSYDNSAVNLKNKNMQTDHSPDFTPDAVKSHLPSEMNNIKQDLKLLFAAVDEINRKHDDLVTKITTISNDLNKLQVGYVDKLNSSLLSMKTDIKKTQEECGRNFQTFETDISSLRDNVAKVNSEIKTDLVNKMNSKYQSIGDKNKKTKDDIASLKTVLSNLDSKFIASVQEFSLMKTQLQSVETAVNGVKTSLEILKVARDYSRGQL